MTATANSSEGFEQAKTAHSVYLLGQSWHKAAVGPGMGRKNAFANNGEDVAADNAVCHPPAMGEGVRLILG